MRRKREALPEALSISAQPGGEFYEVRTASGSEQVVWRGNESTGMDRMEQD
jgi:hypothetical protein